MLVYHKQERLSVAQLMINLGEACSLTQARDFIGRGLVYIDGARVFNIYKEMVIEDGMVIKVNGEAYDITTEPL